MKIIPIQKDLVPYSFHIRLAGETFEFKVRYNDSFDFFTIDLHKNGRVLISGEKVVYGAYLFSSFVLEDIPRVYIMPYDMRNEEEEVTYANLMESVFLYVVEEAELNAVS